MTHLVSLFESMFYHNISVNTRILYHVWRHRVALIVAIYMNPTIRSDASMCSSWKSAGSVMVYTNMILKCINQTSRNSYVSRFTLSLWVKLFYCSD